MVLLPQYISLLLQLRFCYKWLGNSLNSKKMLMILIFNIILVQFNFILDPIFCFILLAPVIAHFYDNALLTSVIRVLGIKLPVSAVNSIQYAYVSRKWSLENFSLQLQLEQWYLLQSVFQWLIQDLVYGPQWPNILLIQLQILPFYFS